MVQASDPLYWAAGAGWVIYAGLALALLLLTAALPLVIYGCLRNLRKIRVAQEETNKLLRQQIATRRGVVTVQKPRV